MTETKKAIEAARLKLEPEAVTLMDVGLYTNERIVEVASAAISLKRIADALEKLAGAGWQGWSLQDIAGLIAERSKLP